MTEQELEQIYEKLLVLDARDGLPEKLFLAVSAIFPVANVDLLILDEENRVLLSWREDAYFGRGWHLPGGCLRYKETMLERLQKTALSELGTEVEVNPEPLAVRDVILGKGRTEPRLRAHHLAVLYECRLRDNSVVQAQDGEEHKSGYMKWFSKLPEDILPVHDVYKDVFAKYDLLGMEKSGREASIQD